VHAKLPLVKLDDLRPTHLDRHPVWIYCDLGKNGEHSHIWAEDGTLHPYEGPLPVGEHEADGSRSFAMRYIAGSAGGRSSCFRCRLKVRQGCSRVASRERWMDSHWYATWEPRAGTSASRGSDADQSDVISCGARSRGRW
jgi:hypothetical protein